MRTKHFGEGDEMSQTQSNLKDKISLANWAFIFSGQDSIEWMVWKGFPFVADLAHTMNKGKGLCCLDTSSWPSTGTQVGF